MYKKYSSALKLGVKWTMGQNTVLCSVVISFHSLLSAELKALEETMSVYRRGQENHTALLGLFQAADQ